MSQGIAIPAASCLVPIADMYNMAARREDVNVMCNTNKDSTHFECYTTTAIPAGKQVRAATNVNFVKPCSIIYCVLAGFFFS